MTEESGRAVAAPCAEGGEARDLVGERDAVQDLSEGVSVKVAVESDDDNMSMKVLDLAPHKQHEVIKELRLVDDDEIDVLGNVVGHLHEVGVGGVAGHANIVVRDDLGVEGVAVVATRFDDEDARPDAAVAPDHGCDEGGLAGKHGTHNDFNTHSAVLYTLSGNTENEIRFSRKIVFWKDNGRGYITNNRYAPRRGARCAVRRCCKGAAGPKKAYGRYACNCTRQTSK